MPIINNKNKQTDFIEIKPEDENRFNEQISQLEFFGFIPEQFLDELYKNLLKEIDIQIMQLSSHNANLIYADLLNEFNKNYRIFKCYSLSFIFSIKQINLIDLKTGDLTFKKKLNLNTFKELISIYKKEREININNQIELKKLQLMNEKIESILKYKNSIKIADKKIKKNNDLINELEKFNKVITENHKMNFSGYLHFKERYAMKFLKEKTSLIKSNEMESLLLKMTENKISSTYETKNQI